MKFKPQNKTHASSETVPSVSVVWWIVLGMISCVFVWSYWLTIGHLVTTWNREPDYSHGFLVVPLAIFFLWLRRHDFPSELNPSWWGLAVLAGSVIVRYGSARISIASGDGYSILIWLSGMALLIGGTRLLMWSMPAIGFLFFMIPLPFRVENLLSHRLQFVATHISSFALQCFGQPAFAEGTTIQLGDEQLEIERTCSGLRIFFGSFALAFAYIIAMRKEIWEVAVLLLGVIPIALFANALRIVITGFLFQYYSGEVAKQFSHDIAGFFMIPVAAGCFALLIWYLSCLVRETESLQLSEIVEYHRSQT